MCHDGEAADHARSLHGQATARGDELAPACRDCHGTHDIRSHTDVFSPTSIINIPLLCGRCHHEGSPVSLARDIPQDHILENYSLSIHGEGLFKKGLTVTAVCTSCHTSHNILPHTDAGSSIHPDNVATTCTRCHGRIEQVHLQVIEGRLWEQEPNKIPSCVDCHSPHEIRSVLYTGVADRDCLGCHASEELMMTRDGKSISLHVDGDAHAGSSHGGTACAQCHTEVDPSRERPCEAVSSPVDCSVCHAAQVAEFEQSTHGTLLAAGDPDAPSCLDCHDKHATQGKALPTSPTFARNVPSLCSGCHRAGEPAAMRIDAAVPDIVQSYVDSIHGKGLLESGLVVTATCASCHGAHTELPPDDPRSSVHATNITGTCGTCHHGIEEVFKTSIHWSGENGSDHNLPTCEDCHTSHTISRTDLPGFRLRMMEQCGHCHEEQAETFFDTFHGKVSRLGSEGAAKCYDCHGTHDILPASDPASSLGRERVVDTCGQCHEGSHRRFAGYLTHATHHDSQKYPYLFWAFWGMTTLLVGTLSFALLHTLAWLVRLWLSRDEWKTAPRGRTGSRERSSFRRFDRVQPHACTSSMMISFFMLALTGMALKFSYMAWARTDRVDASAASIRHGRVLHRLGAVVSVHRLSSSHIWLRGPASEATQSKLDLASADLDRSPTRSCSTLTRPEASFPQSIRWFFGRRAAAANYGRYTYWEKFDYFAVFWGVVRSSAARV